MRGKRSKQYRKLMQQYGMHFGFREPYQVVVDAAILQAAAGFKMDFMSGISKALHGEIKPMITQCCIRHLYESEPQDSIVTKHAKAFERRRCNHQDLEKPLSALECITSVVDPKGTKNNKHRYVVACQDERLRAYLRTIPGVPLIYLKRSVLIMEPMAGVTEDAMHNDERAKFRTGLKSKRNHGNADNRKAEDTTRKAPGAINEDVLGTLGVSATPTLPLPSDSGPAKKKRKRGPSGPNPLSMKKPKAARETGSSSRAHLSHVDLKEDPTGTATELATEERKRKRRRHHRTGLEMG